MSSGKISAEELTRVLTETGRMKLTMDEAHELISMVDRYVGGGGGGHKAVLKAILGRA